MMTEQIKEAVSIPIQGLDPVSQGVATVVTTGVSLKHFNRLMFELRVGDVGAAGTVDAKLRESDAVAGVYSDVVGGAITQIILSNKIATLEMRSDQLSANKAFVLLSVTVAGNAVLISATGFGFEPRFHPTTSNDDTDVIQRLVV